jgi:hypothetical protein
MDGRTDSTQDLPTKDYKSRPGALAWFFRKSRDRWKRKYQDLKATLKGYKNRIADLTRSRQLWRLKAEQAGERLVALEAEVTDLRAQAAAQEDKKNGRGRWPAELHPG